MNTVEMTRKSTAITIWPAHHYASNNKLVRQGWQASLVPVEAQQKEGGATIEDVHQWCPHSHRTVPAAKACALVMWKALP